MADRNRYMYKCTECSQLLLQYKKWQNGGGPSDEPRKTRLNRRAHNEDPCSKVKGAEHRLKILETFTGNGDVTRSKYIQAGQINQQQQQKHTATKNFTIVRPFLTPKDKLFST